MMRERSILARSSLTIGAFLLCSALFQPLGRSASLAAVAQPLAPFASFADCWEIISISCTDCPGHRTYFCNPTVNGIFATCVPAQSYMCGLYEGCLNVSGGTGAGCPNP